MTSVTLAFDYDALEPAAAAVARHAANRIRDRIGSGLVAVGHDLIKAKAALKHGQFAAWLLAEFGMSNRTAQRYMAVAKFADAKSDTVSLLLPETVKALAAPSLPSEIRDQVLDLAKKGETVLPEHIAAARAVRARHRRDAKWDHKRSKKEREAIAEQREAELRRQVEEGVRSEALKSELADLIISRLDQDQMRLASELMGKLGRLNYDISRVLRDAIRDKLERSS